MHDPPDPLALSPTELRQLGEFFLDSGYTEEGLKRLLGGAFPPGTLPEKMALMLDPDGPPTPLTTLVRIFQLGRPVSRQQAADILPNWVVADCQKLGLLTAEGDRWRSDFRLDCIGRTLLVSDSIHAGPVERDFVSGFNRYAKLLMDLTPRVQAVDALDAFASGGVQALHLGEHCRSVSATELNSRAIGFAQLNAGLNGIDQIDWLKGDRFAPAEGRQFDLIVANPPFFVGPALGHLYSDNEMELDAFCSDVVRQGAKHLKPGGYLVSLAEWVDLQGQNWKTRLRGWFEGIGCDAWVMTIHRHSPDRYARQRLLETIDPAQPGSETALKERAAYLREAGVKSILGGAIFLRRRLGTNWIEIDDYPVEVTGPCGNEVLKGFARRDFLAESGSDEGLLESRLIVSDAVGLEEVHRLGESAGQPELRRLRVEVGMKYTAKVNRVIVDLLRSCDGSRTLREALESSGSPRPSGGDNQASLLDTARRLIRRGVLDPQPESLQ